ncbi:DUF4870 family protein [Eoetvoesiella caeni]|uniref:Putative membrane protein n=1 Tax=Eoetvoesiella caeni TaxID=645616 RepID=A0A366H987_9BURK|nr:hypothetical protein [Eoetvoesiella caeni]MCI2809454.1 hypothetical protein [Eoetvoesiella caeni]NYT55950.1 hypothetical protein [Eoetvoesiella caeni]RBP38713.1 putative membrane protein [Eoetvoesiella caeni]
MIEVSPPDNGNGLSMRTVTHVMYGLFALGLISAGFLGLATVAAVVLAYLKRADAAGTVYAAHMDWVLRTFWWGLLWLVLSLIATLFYLGWPALLVLGVWLVYRVIRGWLGLFAGELPTPDL